MSRAPAGKNSRRMPYSVIARRSRRREGWEGSSQPKKKRERTGTRNELHLEGNERLHAYLKKNPLSFCNASTGVGIGKKKKYP